MTVDEFEALHTAGHGDIPAVLPPAPAWSRLAACAGMSTEAFYPEREGARAAIEAARFVCGGCEVAGPCLQWALDHDEFGVWAGTTENQRRAMRREAA